MEVVFNKNGEKNSKMFVGYNKMLYFCSRIKKTMNMKSYNAYYYFYFYFASPCEAGSGM